VKLGLRDHELVIIAYNQKHVVIMDDSTLALAEVKLNRELWSTRHTVIESYITHYLLATTPCTVCEWSAVLAYFYLQYSMLL